MAATWNNLSIKYKILFIACVGVIGLGTILSHSYTATSEIKSRLTAISAVQFPIILHTNILSQNIKNIAENIIAATSDIEMLDDARANMEEAHNELNFIVTTDPHQQATIDTLRLQMDNYFSICLAFATDVYEGRIQMTNDEGFKKAGEVGQLLQELKESIDTFQDTNRSTFSSNLESAITAAQEMLRTGLIVGGSATLVLIAIALLISHKLTEKISVVGKALTALSKQDLSDSRPLDIDSKDEIGNLAQTFNHFLEIFTDNSRKFDAALRIRIALENAASNVMLLDPNNNVIFLNQAFISTFKERENQIQQVRPGFSMASLLTADVSQLVGNNLDFKFQEVDVVQTRVIVLASRTFELTIAPVHNEDQERLGVVIEWNDLSEIIQRARKKREDAAFLKEQEAEAAEQIKLIANENARVRQALDNVATAAMILDKDDSIIYLNESAKALMKHAEASIKKQRPGFSAASLLLSPINAISKGLNQKFRDTKPVELKIGEHIFRITSNVIIADNTKIGMVLEWLDRSAEIIIEDEIDELVNAAVNGDFSTRINETDKSDFSLRLSKGLNLLLYTVDAGINDVQRVLNAISKGDLSQTIDANYKGSFLALKSSSNDTVRRIKSVMSEIGNLVSAGNEGDFSSRISLAGKTGFFKDLSTDLNLLVNTTDAGLADIQRVLDAMSKGDLSQTIDANYRGAFEKLKDLSNDTVNKIRVVMTEIGDLVNAGNQGNFESQISLVGKTGFFKDLSTNLNLLVVTTNAGLTDIQRVLEAMSKGDLSQTIDADYRGSFLTLKNLSNDTVNKIQSVMNEIGDLVKAGNQGNFNSQISLSGKTGFFEEISTNLNRLVETTNAGLSDIQRVLGAMSRGDLSQTIDASYLGSFLALKDLSNDTVNKIQSVMNEIGNLVEAGNQGDFSSQIDLQGKVGFFKTLTDSLNNLVSTTNMGLTNVHRVLSAVANGDLTDNITEDYSGAFDLLKTDVNTTVSKLTEIITNLQQTSSALTQGAREIVAGNNQLSQQTKTQNTSLDQTSHSLQDMTELVVNSAVKADEASKKAASVTEDALQGGKVIADAVGAMEEISLASKNILNIITVIDDIAFQTNLLALNAAVEAARAGEEGRGFAVVAEEVRSLAHRSAESAKEIKTLISNSVNMVEYGSGLVGQAGETLTQLVQSIVDVSELMQSINLMCNNQRTSIEHINTEIKQMESISNQSENLVEVASTSSLLISNQTDEMRQKMAYFELKRPAGNS
ncbi:MAG: HAMP domain-containing protein [Pseudomonadales bacterium]|nr:HAMP domain-containing protein [Pseudomonadales bacterium]